MSLTFIAITGILAGFLCLVVGFFLEDVKEPRAGGRSQAQRVIRPAKKKEIVPRKKAA